MTTNDYFTRHNMQARPARFTVIFARNTSDGRTHLYCETCHARTTLTSDNPPHAEYAQLTDAHRANRHANA